ncbi:membrane protein, partial [human gut metagenome]
VKLVYGGVFAVYFIFSADIFRLACPAALVKPFFCAVQYFGIYRHKFAPFILCCIFPAFFSCVPYPLPSGRRAQRALSACFVQDGPRLLPVFPRLYAGFSCASFLKSGEHLLENGYTEKAEVNMMNLLQETENSKKKSRSSLLAFGITVINFFIRCFIFCYYQYGNRHSLQKLTGVDSDEAFLLRDPCHACS